MTNRSNPRNDPGATWAPCPRCSLPRLRTDRPALNALSRTDNATHVCSPCGSDEAMRDHAGDPPVPPTDWPMRAEGGR